MEMSLLFPLNDESLNTSLIACLSTTIHLMYTNYIRVLVAIAAESMHNPTSECLSSDGNYPVIIC